MAKPHSRDTPEVYYVKEVYKEMEKPPELEYIVGALTDGERYEAALSKKNSDMAASSKKAPPDPIESFFFPYEEEYDYRAMQEKSPEYQYIEANCMSFENASFFIQESGDDEDHVSFMMQHKDKSIPILQVSKNQRDGLSSLNPEDFEEFEYVLDQFEKEKLRQGKRCKMAVPGESMRKVFGCFHVLDALEKDEDPKRSKNAGTKNCFRKVFGCFDPNRNQPSPPSTDKLDQSPQRTKSIRKIPQQPGESDAARKPPQERPVKTQQNPLHESLKPLETNWISIVREESDGFILKAPEEKFHDEGSEDSSPDKSGSLTETEQDIAPQPTNWSESMSHEDDRAIPFPSGELITTDGYNRDNEINAPPGQVVGDSVAIGYVITPKKRKKKKNARTVSPQNAASDELNFGTDAPHLDNEERLIYSPTAQALSNTQHTVDESTSVQVESKESKRERRNKRKAKRRALLAQLRRLSNAYPDPQKSSDSHTECSSPDRNHQPDHDEYRSTNGNSDHAGNIGFKRTEDGHAEEEHFLNGSSMRIVWSEI